MVLAVLWLTGCSDAEKIETEIVIGYRGQARVNPFLAAERFLQAEGFDAEGTPAMSEYPWGATILITRENVPSYAMTDAMKTWVGEGGHLIYLLKGGAGFADDFSGAKAEELDQSPDPIPEDYDPGSFMLLEDEEQQSLDDDPVLRRFGVLIAAKNGQRVRDPIRWRGNEYDLDLPPGVGLGGLTSGRQVEALGARGETEGHAIVSFPHGTGRVTVMSDVRWLRNRWLDEGDHAAFLSDFIGFNEGYEVWFVHGTRTSLWRLLFRVAWMPLLGLACLILLWLWKSILRFGPIEADSSIAPLDFGDHVAASGEFMWKHRDHENLLEPLRRSVLRALRSKHPQRSTAPEFIAARSGLPAEDVVFALSEVPEDGSDFISMVQTLQKIQRSLQSN